MNADAGTFGAESFRSFGTDFHALAVVNNFEGHFFGVHVDANDCGGAIGVAMDVGEAFLHDAEQSDFGFRGKAHQVRGDIHGDADSGAGFKPLRVPMEGGTEAEFIEQRRVQQIGKSADLAGDLVGEGLALARNREKSGIIVQFAQHLGEIHGLQREFLAGDVVQVAGDAAAFVVLYAHGIGGKAAQGFGLALFLGSILDGQKDEVFARMGFDAAGVDAHGAGAEMREVVTDFEIVGALIVQDDLVKQSAKGGNVPLLFAEIVNQLSFRFRGGNPEEAAKGGIGQSDTKITIENQQGFAGVFNEGVGEDTSVIEIAFENINIVEAEDGAFHRVAGCAVGTNTDGIPFAEASLAQFAIAGRPVLDGVAREFFEVGGFKVGEFRASGGRHRRDVNSGVFARVE